MNKTFLWNRCMLLLSALCLQAALTAQNLYLGAPPIWNFPKKTYHAGTQNWDAVQDTHGVLYWANNEGLLTYDGVVWRCYPVSNNTIVRSVAIDTVSRRIYVGAQGELGYFAPAPNGALQYHSLINLIPPDQRRFEDVWDIVFFQNAVFFRTNQRVFRFSGNDIIRLEPGGALTALFVAGQSLYLQQDFSHLLRYDNNQFQPALEVSELTSALTGCIPFRGDTLLLSSLKNGLFYLYNGEIGRWVTAYDDFFRTNRIYSATALAPGRLALGTSSGGLVLLDQSGAMIRRLTKQHGLQRNNILHTFQDKSGNLWLGLDNGIDCIVPDAPLSTIIPDGDLLGAGYAAAVFQGNLYLGSTDGVYATPWQPDRSPYDNRIFRKISGADGQVWSLNALDGQLLMGHHEGAFSLEAGAAGRLAPPAGAWTFVPLSDQHLLGGNYNGLVLYRKSGARWVFDRPLRGLSESCRIMVRDADGAVWISHPYRGLFRVTWSPETPDSVSVAFYNASNGLPSDLNNAVFSIAGRAVFGTENGVYRFDKTTGRFVPDEDFNRTLGAGQRIKYLKEDPSGNIWYVRGQEVGMLQVVDLGLKKEVRKKVFPELSGKLVGGFEFIYPYDARNVLIGAEQGFFHYNPEQAPGADTLLQVVISSATATGAGDSTLVGGSWWDPTRPMPQLAAAMSTLRFMYAATDFSDPGFLQYRIRLTGLSPDWSEWTSETIHEFAHLNPGKYVFEVQARRKDGRMSAVVHYPFCIRPPWYKSTLALLFYGVAFIGLLASGWFQQQRRFEQEKAQLTARHRQAETQHLENVERTKAALIAVENAKLEADIRFKNQELAAATMHLVQKGEILLTVQETLNEILEKSAGQPVSKEIQQLLNLLNFDKRLDESWEIFAQHFDQVHVDFLKRLREKYPQLSQNDYKLCAYLKMNLSTKEIAPLMNVSVRGVEASRYRLRKKLQLANDANLTDFIMEI